MKSVFKNVSAVIGVFIAVLIMAFAINGAGMGLNAVFSPKEVQVSGVTYTETHAQQVVTVQDLQSLHSEYIRTADLNSRRTLSQLILRRSEGVPYEAMPPDLAMFIKQLRMFQASAHYSTLDHFG